MPNIAPSEMLRKNRPTTAGLKSMKARQENNHQPSHSDQKPNRVDCAEFYCPMSFIYTEDFADDS
jgi:hypothetical protein